MMNPVRNLMSDSEKGPDPNGMRGKMDMLKEADKALHSTSPAAPAKPPMKPAPVDKVNPTGKYGDNPGEKRIDVKDMVKPLGQMHKGGTVPKTGPYIMKAGEKVLTPEQHGHIKNAMGLAMDALSHEPDADDMQQAPPKTGKDMTIRQLHDQSFHIKHRHEPPHDMPEHDEEYSAPDMKGLHDHIDKFWGKK